MMALSCVLTLAVRIPSPTKGYLNLGDCAVLFGGWLLGPVCGPIAGGVGSALADLFAGYPVYIPGTVIIKAAMAFFVSLLPNRFVGNERKRPGVAFIAASVLAEAFMTVGYWFYEAVVIGEGFAAAFAGVSGNVVQGAAGAAGAYFLTGVLSRTGIPGLYGRGCFGKGRAK
jgi:uncharacterized membrane protein